MAALCDEKVIAESFELAPCQTFPVQFLLRAELAGRLNARRVVLMTR